MIVTLTANPSVDRTLTLDGALARGGVCTAVGVTDQPGGKGVNVARVVALAGAPATAVLPADSGDPIVAALVATGVRAVPIPVGSGVRTNITVTEPDGTTTKVNEPGHPLTETARDALVAALVEASRPGGWVVLAGSVPPGVPDGWYAAVTATLKRAGRRVAVDTSGSPLVAVVRGGGGVGPDLIKPNAEELSALTGVDPTLLESDPRLAERAARGLLDTGVGSVLLTLGAAGALLVTRKGSWQATPPPVLVRSTVGAGDSSLAGYLLAEAGAHDPAGCLREAVAFGAAAASLPGSTMPRERDLDRAGTTVVAFDPTL